MCHANYVKVRLKSNYVKKIQKRKLVQQPVMQFLACSKKIKLENLKSEGRCGEDGGGEAVKWR